MSKQTKPSKATKPAAKAASKDKATAKPDKVVARPAAKPVPAKGKGKAPAAKPVEQSTEIKKRGHLDPMPVEQKAEAHPWQLPNQEVYPSPLAPANCPATVVMTSQNSEFFIRTKDMGSPSTLGVAIAQAIRAGLETPGREFATTAAHLMAAYPGKFVIEDYFSAADAWMYQIELLNPKQPLVAVGQMAPRRQLDAALSAANAFTLAQFVAWVQECVKYDVATFDLKPNDAAIATLAPKTKSVSAIKAEQVVKPGTPLPPPTPIETVTRTMDEKRMAVARLLANDSPKTADNNLLFHLSEPKRDALRLQIMQVIYSKGNVTAADAKYGLVRKALLTLFTVEDTPNKPFTADQNFVEHFNKNWRGVALPQPAQPEPPLKSLAQVATTLGKTLMDNAMLPKGKAEAKAKPVASKSAPAKSKAKAKGKARK